MKLRSTDYTNKAILFVVFPVEHDNEKWQTHLRKISELLEDIKHRELRFKNEVPGAIYFGSIGSIQ